MRSIANLIQGWPLVALAALVAGTIVLLAPRALNYAVAVYLLFIGTIGLLHHLHDQPIRLQAIVALVAGMLILFKPQLLSYVVGIYLILVGLLAAGILPL